MLGLALYSLTVHTCMFYDRYKALSTFAPGYLLLCDFTDVLK